MYVIVYYTPYYYYYNYNTLYTYTEHEKLEKDFHNAHPNNQVSRKCKLFLSYFCNK